MTSTKTFITTYLVVYLLAGALDGRRVDNALLDSVVREVGLQLEKGGFIYPVRSLLSGHPFVQVIGRGYGFCKRCPNRPDVYGGYQDSGFSFVGR